MHEPTWKQELARLVADARPDRYTPGEDDQWIEDLITAQAPSVPLSDAQEALVRREIQRLEKAALHSGNRFLRECLTQPVLTPSWVDLPIAVGKERVAIRACTANDFDLSAQEERRNAALDFSARNEVCIAKEEIASRMRMMGWATGADVIFE